MVHRSSEEGRRGDTNPGLKESKAACLEEIGNLKQKLTPETDPDMRRLLQEDLRRDEELVAVIKKAIPD